MEYQRKLQAAKEQLFSFVSQFSLKSLGLTSSYLLQGCPETERNLFECMQNYVSEEYEKLGAGHLVSHA